MKQLERAKERLLKMLTKDPRKMLEAVFRQHLEDLSLDPSCARDKINTKLVKVEELDGILLKCQGRVFNLAGAGAEFKIVRCAVLELRNLRNGLEDISCWSIGRATGCQMEQPEAATTIQNFTMVSPFALYAPRSTSH